MMNDYSEVTATLNREVTELIHLLNDKNWAGAYLQSRLIQANITDLCYFIKNKAEDNDPY